jgi:hypothetical protein
MRWLLALRVGCSGRREEACLADFIIGSDAWVGKVNCDSLILGVCQQYYGLSCPPLFLRINNSHKETLDLESTPSDTLPFEVTYENHGSK